MSSSTATYIQRHSDKPTHAHTHTHPKQEQLACSELNKQANKGGKKNNTRAPLLNSLLFIASLTSVI